MSTKAHGYMQRVAKGDERCINPNASTPRAALTPKHRRRRTPGAAQAPPKANTVQSTNTARSPVCRLAVRPFLKYIQGVNAPAARTVAERPSSVIWRCRVWRKASLEIGPQVGFLPLRDPRHGRHCSVYCCLQQQFSSVLQSLIPVSPLHTPHHGASCNVCDLDNLAWFGRLAAYAVLSVGMKRAVNPFYLGAPIASVVMR